MATQEPLPLRPRGQARLGWLTRALAAILALTLSTILALTLPHAMPSSGHAAAPALERLDIHSMSTGSEEREINLAVGTGNECASALTPGQYCLRYSVTLDDQPIDVGFGAISSSAVQMSGPTLALHLNTATAGFHHLHGSGGPINVIWTPHSHSRPTTAHGHTTALAAASVVGTVDGNPLAGTQVQASVLTTQ
jgi:hypothetical protein